MEQLDKFTHMTSPEKKMSSASIKKACLAALYLVLSAQNLGTSSIAPRAKSSIIESGPTPRLIKEKYDIELNSSAFSDTWDIRYTPTKSEKEFAPIILEMLSQYSPLLVRLSGVKKIVLTENLKYHDNERCRRKAACQKPKCKHLSRINGIQYSDAHIFYVNTIPDAGTPVSAYITRIGHHELYHTIDDALLPNDSDRLFWAKENQYGKKQYQWKKWRKAEKRAGKLWVLPGFAEPYGISTLYEDKATVNARLRVPYYSKKLLKQCRYDNILKRKIEMLTGCQLDTKSGKFSKTYSAEEYQEIFGSDDMMYFWQWWRNVSDTITMDHFYWNSIIDSWMPNVTNEPTRHEVHVNPSNSFLDTLTSARQLQVDMRLKNYQDNIPYAVESLIPKEKPSHRFSN